MRRLFLSVALLALTATLVAQTPQSMTLTKPDAFHCKVTYLARQQDGDRLLLKNATLEFEMGVTVAADELVFDKGTENVVKLSGNVQMTLKH